MTEGVDADDAVQLAQDLTGLDCSTASTKARYGDLKARIVLFELHFTQLADLDAAHVLLAKQGVDVHLARLVALLGRQVAVAGGVEDDVLDALVLLEDRTDPLCL